MGARLWQMIREHRRRVAMLVAVVGVLVVGGRIFEAVPREVSVEFSVPEHGVEAVQVAYFLSGDEVSGVRFDSPRPPLRHTLSLSPGRYHVEAVIRAGEGQRVVRRALRVPAEGIVHIDLGDDRLEPGPR